MCSKQLSPEETFEQSRTATYETEHYVFHFTAGSLAEKDILTIAQTQEAAFVKICATLNVVYPQRIHYYFTESALDIGRMIWNEESPCNGCAMCGQNKIYAVYSEEVKCIGAHEDTHLISFLINFPESDFIVEGLAMYSDGLWWGVSNEEWAAFYKAKRPDLSISMLLDNDSFADVGCQITYPVAGAFTRYLIDRFGIEKYIQLYQYKEDQYDSVFQQIFSGTLAEIEGQFWRKMCEVSYNGAKLEDMLEDEGF